MTEWALYDSIYEEAKRDCPHDPWPLYHAACGELHLSRAYKAQARGSVRHNPLTRLVTNTRRTTHASVEQR